MSNTPGGSYFSAYGIGPPPCIGVDMNPIAECHRCGQGFAQRAPTFLVADLWLRLLPIHPSGPMDMAADLHGLAASKGAMSVHAGREVVVVREAYAEVQVRIVHSLPTVCQMTKVQSLYPFGIVLPSKDRR
jgi:hypothetical protein